MSHISTRRLRELVSYDADTGKFFSRIGRPSVSFGAEMGCVNRGGYVVIRLDRKLYYAHRLAWQWMFGVKPAEIDHADGDPSNNKLANLRIATSGQNKQNKKVRRDSRTGFKWVCRIPSGYRASVKVDGKNYNLGTYASAVLAHECAVAAAKKLHGEFFQC